jgi:membrane fusion protein, heavy metal efflux system
MKKTAGILVAICLILSACQPHEQGQEGHEDHSGHNHEGHNHGGHEHGDNDEVISYTLWEDDTELFVEFAAFVAGKSNRIRILATNLNGFTATEGELSLQIRGGKKIKSTKRSTGIFGTSLKIKEAGEYDLIFVLETEGVKKSFVLQKIPVAKDAHDVYHINYTGKDDKGTITYEREKSWTQNFSAEIVKMRPVGDIIHSSGVIEPSSSDLTTIVAKSDGVISIRKKNMTSGTSVRRGELLFSVAGKGIVQDNLEMNYLKAQSNLDRAESTLERKKKLLADKIIGQNEYELAKNQYDLAAAEYNNIKKLFSKGERRHLITNPADGFVSHLMVQEGQFVKAGQQLASILKTNKIQVKIDVSPRFRSLLPKVDDANFVNPYNNKAYRMQELDGRILSFGRMTSHEEGHYIPMYFEINNHPDLLPGAMIEAYLMTQAVQEKLTVPKSSVLEEMGSYVVFVQKSGKTYEKQVVEIGSEDGKYVEILNGLSIGDRVVSSGSLQIKLASMNNAVDPHAGHVH